MTRPIYGTVRSMGHSGDLDATSISINCPLGDNPSLEGVEGVRSWSKTWLNAVVEIRVIRPGGPSIIQKKKKK